MFKIGINANITNNARIFNSRFVNKVKYESTDKAYEKSQLIVQTYNDQEKDHFLK